MRTSDKTPWYVRTAEGECFYVESLDEALEQLISESGYRMTISGEHHEVVIRRGDVLTKSSQFDDTYEGEASLTVRMHRA